MRTSAEAEATEQPGFQPRWIVLAPSLSIGRAFRLRLKAMADKSRDPLAGDDQGVNPRRPRPTSASRPDSSAAGNHCNLPTKLAQKTCLIRGMIEHCRRLAAMRSKSAALIALLLRRAG